MVLSDDVHRLIDAALTTGDWAAAAGALRGDQPLELIAPPVVALIDAFAYGLTLASDHRREQGGEYVPCSVEKASPIPRRSTWSRTTG